MINREFKKWLKSKGIDFSDYTLMDINAQQEINAAYTNGQLKLNRRYNIKDLEKHYPSICVEMKNLKRVKGQVVSGVLVNVFPNVYKAEERYWELMTIGNISNYILGLR